MASNTVTLDHIKSFLSLDDDIQPLNITPTATGGAGINNRDEFPPPKPYMNAKREKDTSYVYKYLGKFGKPSLENSMMPRLHLSQLSIGSNLTVNALDDLEEVTTVGGDIQEATELDSERTKQLYSTYYNVPNRVYDPDLTITNYREEILQQININHVVIVQGPTGCGKTTQVPQYILDYHAAKEKYCNIIVTQPRKIAAISIAKRVCQERGWQLGTLVGYQVGMDPNISADTRLCYVTTGVLLEKLVAAQNMNKYTHVIIDEVHERDQDIDFALLLVKKFLMTNSQSVKVILMSATFDTTVFSNYFSLSNKGDLAPVVNVVGKSKEVTEHYLPELKTLMTAPMPEFDFFDPMLDPCLFDTTLNLLHVFDKIEKAEQNVTGDAEYAPNRGAVLIFLPGYDDISALSNKLSTARFDRKFWVIPLHSMITSSEQSKVFQHPPADHRKVILSTNVAESSITVPDVKYVIDFCLTKNLTTDPNTNYSCLQLEWASKANCTQRKGRAGRVDIGKVYRMVPKSFYEKFVEYSTPEIKRCPLTSVILHLKRLDVGEPQELLAFAVDPPYLYDIENAVLLLKEALGLYGKGSNLDGNLTFVGNIMASLPLDIKLSKLILFGYAFSCLEDCIIMAASLSLQSFFSKPFQKQLESYRSRLFWAKNTFDDCFAYLNAYKDWKNKSNQSYFLKPGGMKEKEWCAKHYIEPRRIKEVDKLVKELRSRLERHNIYVDSRHADSESPMSRMILKIVVAGAFFPHYFMQERLDEKTVMREVNDNDPLSTVVVTHLPNHGILYACALRDMFKCCSDRINIEIEDRKAYIKFEGSDTSSIAEEMKLPALSVQLPVYLAVKMRQLRMPLELSVFSNEEAERKMEQIRLLKNESSNKMLASNRFSVSLRPSSQLPKLRLPSGGEMLVPIFISHVIDCGHFWARYVRIENSEQLKFIEYAIFNCQQSNRLKPLERRPDLNMLCLAPFREGNVVQYYRAEVRDVKNGMVKVFFVDYGNEETMRESELREIDEELSKVIDTPVCAFECFLSELKPSASRHYLGIWSTEANAWFKRIVSGRKLEAKIFSVVGESVRLELLYQTERGTIESINKQLVAKGFAVPAEEGLLSKQDHEYRIKCLEYSNTSVSNEKSVFSPVELSLEEAVKFSDIRTTRNKVRLMGPSNPLEISYSGMTYIDRSKCITIDPESVNSVSFNAEPQDPCSSMLVAASLAIGAKSDKICARNTTLMPKIMGLPSLLCLIFSPFVEIRTDKARTSYTGALCGLGYDFTTGESIFPDHDLELEFDIDIDLQDLLNINTVRMGMNMLLQMKDESKAMIAQCRQTLRKKIIDLLQTKRTPKEPCYFAKTGHWNQIPSTLLLQPQVDSSADNPQVLPLIRPPGLNAMNS